MNIDPKIVKDAEALNISIGGEFDQSAQRWRGISTEKIGNTRYLQTEAIYTTEVDAYQGIVDLVKTVGRPLTVAEQAAKVGKLEDRNAQLEAEIARLKAEASPDVPTTPAETGEPTVYEPIETTTRGRSRKN